MISRLFVYRTENKIPYQNLALEEYLTLHTEPEECILFLWQNQHTVVIGKNQNCWKECKVNDLEEDGGYLVRRLSGGGAVYHDLGNLNFTFCVRRQNYDVSRQMDVILEAVRSFGIDAEKTGRNDITVNGRKISGNAFYKSGDYCYHHGTLLVSADKEIMSRYLNVSKEKLKSKGVDSVPSRVANLREFTDTVTVETLENALWEAFSGIYGGKAKALPEERLDWDEIAGGEKRFASWEWKYGRNIPFQHCMERRFSWGDAELQFEVSQGIVKNVNIFSDGMEQELIGKIPERLVGCRYSAGALTQVLGQMKTLPGTEEAAEMKQKETEQKETEQKEMEQKETECRMLDDICALIRENL